MEVKESKSIFVIIKVLRQVHGSYHNWCDWIAVFEQIKTFNLELGVDI